MERRLLLFVLPIILLAAVLAGIGSLPTAHAPGFPGGPGLVCLGDASHVGSLTPPQGCPSTPYSFDAPPPTPAAQISPTQIRVGIYINGSAPMDGFDITLVTNTLLPPAYVSLNAIDLTGSVLLGTPVIVLLCVNGQLVTGSTCAGADTVNTIHLAATSALGSPLTGAPTTGLLFNAVFNVTGTTTAAGVPINFQSGCTGVTSVSGGVCVTIANGTPTPNQDTVQAATFNNSGATIAWVGMSSPTLTFTVGKGGASPSATVTATAQNGFPGFTGTDLVAFSALTMPGFTAPTFSAASCTTGGASCTTIVTFNTGTAGTYVVTIDGTYAGFDASGNTFTLNGPVNFVINISDVGFTINGAAFGGTQTAYVAKTGGSNVFLVTAQSLGGYSGTITYTEQINPTGNTAGLTAASFVNPAVFTLTAAATVTKAINVTSAPNEGVTQIKISQVTSPSVGAHLSGLITIKVSGFTLISNSTSVTFATGGSRHVQLTSASLGNPPAINGFAGAVALTAPFTGPTGGVLTFSYAPGSSITLAAGGTGSVVVAITGTTAGTYSVTFTGAGGTNNDMTNSTLVTVMITSAGPPPGVNLTSSPTSVTANVGSPGGTSTVTVASRGGFTGTVNLSVAATGSAACSLNPTSVILGTSGTSTLTCTSTVAQTITATVTSTATGATNNQTIITFAFRDFSVAASPTSVNTTAGTAAPSTITVAPLNGFTGTVALVVTTNSTNLVCTLSVTSITGGSGSSTLSCAGSPAGNYLATVTGTSSTLSHSATVVYHVAPAADFTVTASPTSVTVNAGAASPSTITVSPINGFTGTVNLAVTTNSTNLVCTLSSATISGGSGTSTLSCHGSPAGNYLATVTGTSGTLSHSATVTYHAQDFAVSANPTSVSVNVGVAGTSSITVAPLNGFTGTVTLAITTNSTNLSCTLSATSLTGGSGSSTLSCTGSPAGNYLATVTGTSGTLSHSATVVYHVTNAADFTVTSNPTSITLNAGVTGPSTITVAPLNGFTGTVNLAVTTNSTNLVCTLSATSITGGFGSSTLSCHGSPAGNYLVTVTGTSGSLSHSATVTYHVQDFTVAASPATVSPNVGIAGTSTVTVAALNGFTGTVTLAVTTNSTNLVCTLSVTSITGGSGSSTLSCAGSPAGNYLATVTGTSSTLSHSATVVYHVTNAPDFSIAANPTSVNVNAGASATSTITVSSLNGFTGTVTLAVTTNSTNLVCTLSSTSVAGSSGTSTLSCHGSPAGNYLATVTGTSGTLSHSTTVTFHAQDFTVSANPTVVNVNTGVAGTSTISVSSANGFSGTVALAATTNSTNLSCTLSSISIAGGSGSSTLSCSASIAGNYLATITGTSGALSHAPSVVYHVTTVAQPDFTITANPTSVAVNVAAAGTSIITISPVNGFTGAVTLTVGTNSTNLVCTLSSTSVTGGSGISTLSCTASQAGNYLATVTGTSSTLSHSATVTYHAQDFVITASTTSVTVTTSSPGTATITVSSLNGFAATVTLAVTTNSTNLSCTLSATSIAGGSGTSTLSCSSATAGNYLATVTGTSSALSHSVSVVYHVTNVPDFSISASPTSINVNAGVTASSTISVSPANGFTGTVTLTVTTTPTGLACTLSSTSIAGGSGTSTLSCTGSPASNYLATVTGTSGLLSHSATVTYHVQDFTITANPSSVTTNMNVAGTATVSVAPVNGFTGTVALGVTTNSTNLSCALSQASITGGSGSSTLSCSASVAGNYLATVTGTSGTLTHSTGVVYHVTTVAQPDFTISASPTTVTVNVGVAGHSSITVSPLNGFAGTVTLVITTSSTSLSCTLSATTITGGSGTSNLSCTGSSAGSFVATVTGTSGSLSHSVNVNVAVGKANPTLVTLLSSNSITVGNSVSDSATLTGSFQAGGTVTYSVFSGNICSAPGKVVSIVAVTGGVVPNSRLVTFNSTGDFGFQAAYSGDANNNGAMSSCEPLTVSTNVSIRTTLSATTIAVGGSVTDSATLAGQSATASGTVTYTDFANGVCASPGTIVSVVRVANGVIPNSRAVTFNSTGSFSFQAVYSGDANDNSAISSCETLTVTSSTGQPVLLTFQGFDVDDFDNGVGQLQVLVNGQLVVDIPAGLNHLTGSGDYAPYDNTWVNFGPFDITGFVVPGQNTILFKDPQTSDHFALVKNVTIVQGNTVLLHVERARGVYPGFSFTYTFSSPPLVITGFTALPASPVADQGVVFTASYTGGTAPFRCSFSFGDGGSASVAGVNGTCSATHHYDSSGTFSAVVTIRGASTSDLQRARLTITVSEGPDQTAALALLATVDTE